MLDFQQKRKVRSFMYHKVTLVVLGLLVLVLARSTWVVFEKKRDSENTKNLSLQNVLELEARDSELQSKIAKLETDSGIEEEIRSKFSVVKSGEKMVIVVENPDSSVSTTTSRLGFWTRLSAFFGW
ncbi:MAG TPA: septum formation initiator family protein [Candidatus Paceibacterota bacterium]